MASEKPHITAIRRGDFLQPYAPLDSELIRALPANKPLKVVATQPRRSSPQNRLYWALLNLIAENLDQDVEPETLHEWFKLRLGVTREIKLRSGEIQTVTASTAFDAMPHPEFTAYMAGVKRLVVDHLIPRANCAAFEREALAMIGEAA